MRRSIKTVVYGSLIRTDFFPFTNLASLDQMYQMIKSYYSNVLYKTLLLFQVVLYREKEILNTEADMPSLYQLLTHMPDNLPIEQLLSTAGDLYIQYPPTELANEALQRFKKSVFSSFLKYLSLSQLSPLFFAFCGRLSTPSFYHFWSRSPHIPQQPQSVFKGAHFYRF